ncbi:retrotransposon protein, putative, ty1-copia subclass [Tanacetum coccineum]
MEDDKETDEHEEVEEVNEAELKKNLVIVKDDDIAIDTIPLATKPPVIVEYKLLKEGIMTLWKLVKTKHGDTRPEDEHERVLWGDLKVMFEPNIKSDVWRNLQGYKVTVWKLFDSCGVHFVRAQELNPTVFVVRNVEFLEDDLITEEGSGSLEDLEIIQNKIRILLKTLAYIMMRLGDLNKLGNNKAALLDPESDKWLDDMNVYMQSMKDNEVWDLVDLLLDGKTVGSKWLFKKKTDMDGSVHTYKALLVAKGVTQTYGVDYEETFSPVADIKAIKILIAIAAFYDYEI